MGRHAVPLPRQLSRAPFRVADASDHGVGRSRLRGRDLIRPVRGVRTRADADLATRCRALLLHRPEGMWFSHLTASRLYGLPLPSRSGRDERIHVSVLAPARAPQIAGVASHVATAADVRMRSGLPVTGPAHLWIELAACLHRDELVVVADTLIAAELATTGSLAEAIRQSPGRRGISTARLALPLVRPGSESPAESALRVILDDAGLTPPELNYRIHSRDGSFLARVDMAYPERRLVLEYEGDYHRVERDQWHKDIRRQAAIEDLGWRVIRVTAADLIAPAELVARTRRILSEW